MTRPTRLRRIVPALALVLVVGASCSVSTNDEPVAVNQVFDRLVQPTTTTSPTTAPPQDATRTVSFFFIRSTDGASELEAVDREVEVDAGPQQILSNLFADRPANNPDVPPAERNLTNAIPDTAALRSATMSPGEEGRLVVDTEGLFGDRGVVGPQLRNALAQIVCTATNLGSVDEVAFQSEGRRVSAIVGSGSLADRAVDCSDYRVLD